MGLEVHRLTGDKGADVVIELQRGLSGKLH